MPSSHQQVMFPSGMRPSVNLIQKCGQSGQSVTCCLFHIVQALYSTGKKPLKLLLKRSQVLMESLLTWLDDDGHTTYPTKRFKSKSQGLILTMQHVLKYKPKGASQ